MIIGLLTDIVDIEIPKSSRTIKRKPNNIVRHILISFINCRDHLRLRQSIPPDGAAVFEHQTRWMDNFGHTCN